MPYGHSQHLIVKARSITTALFIVVGLNGCAVGRHVSNLADALMIHAQEKRDLALIRSDTRDALAEQREEARRLAAERDVAEARMAAERERLEMEFCLANQEALQRRVQQNVRQITESKVAFQVEHGMEVGELEVDVAELKELIEKREEEQRRPPDLPVKRPCECCDRPCGCEGGAVRRHCVRCRHKPCEAERKCGGEEALTRLEELPFKRPLRPAEIPMKLPVRLTFGFQQPQLETSRIRRIPDLPEEFRRPPCDVCPPGGCRCETPCIQGSGTQHQVRDWPTWDESQPTSHPTHLPPTPEPELEARRLYGRPIESGSDILSRPTPVYVSSRKG